MIKKSFMLLMAVTLLSVAFPLNKVNAATFNPNRIIDDGIFDSTNTMNASQVDSFLNSFPNSCISANSGFRAIDPNGYNPSQGFIYGGYVTAGQVIYDASQAYGLNPQVLLTTLEKEQSLVTGRNNFSGYCNNGDQHKYAAAVGYGCPDSGTTYSYTGLSLYQRNGVVISDTGTTCVNSASKAGFSQQVIRAAWLLKFGQQRSKGNINWAVIKGNWNNSDDPQTCYGGPMTQGTWQRCPSGSTTYYDGYTTIDATSVHMDTGGTAALYWYTPHFAGNQNFFNIFTSWFGSTQFPQPIGGSLYYQISTGNIYLVTQSTRYYIPDWGVLTNYGLDAFPTQPASDTEIGSFSDGGALTNLVWDTNGVYLVNNKVRYHLTDETCTSWGLSCYDSSKVVALGSSFETQYLQTSPNDLGPLVSYGGNIYKMDAGKKLPIANPKTLSDLGFVNTPLLISSPSNFSALPLGPLLMTTPGVIQFLPSPTIYYYDGSSYFSVADMGVYADWGLADKTQLSATTSSYNTSPPSSNPLPTFYQNSNGKYIIDQSRLIKIPSSLEQSFSPVSFSSSGPTALINSLGTETLNSAVWTNPTIYTLSNNKKHVVPSLYDYTSLGLTGSNVTGLKPNKLAEVPEGNNAFGSGKVISINDGSGKLYVVNDTSLLLIKDPNVFNGYGYNWSNIPTYALADTSEYTIDSNSLFMARLNDGTHYLLAGTKAYSIPSSLAADFGFINTNIPVVNTHTIQSNTPAISTRFMRDSSNGDIYYASGGAIHHVTSYASFIAYGGDRVGVMPIDHYAVSFFVIAQPI